MTDVFDLVKKSGRTQRSIAADLNVSPSHFGDTLHGRKPFRISWVIPFCKAVGCSPNELFEWKE